MRGTKQVQSLCKKDHSSNLSSAEFMIDPQKEEELMQNVSNNNHTESNAQLNFFQSKPFSNNTPQPIANSNNAINSSAYNTPSNQNSIAVVWGKPDNETIPNSAKPPSITQINGQNEIDEENELNIKRKQLFNPKEHQSLMEIPHREIQSVYSPSQQFQTPSNNDLSVKIDNSGYNKKGSSSVHLSLDLKAIEEKTKRHSILKQRISEMQDNSQDQSSKAMSNDQQSLIGKLGSQFDREEQKYLALSHGNMASLVLNPPQYNQIKSNLMSSNATIINNSSSLMQLNNHYGSPNNFNIFGGLAEAQKQINNNNNTNNTLQNHRLLFENNNISAIQMEKNRKDNGMEKYVSEPNKYPPDEDVTIGKQKGFSRLKIQQSMLPINVLQKKRDRLVTLFIEKLKESTALLRKPTLLKARHYQMINDLSCSISVVLAKQQWCLFSTCLTKLTDCIPLSEPTSFIVTMNALLQAMLIAILVFSTSLEMVFNVSNTMSKDFLHYYLSTVCFVVFFMDALIQLNTNKILDSDENRYFMKNPRSIIAITYLKSYFLADLPALVLLPFDSQDVFSLDSSKYYLFLRIAIFLKMITFFKHFSTLQTFVLTKDMFISAFMCLKFILLTFVFAHMISLAWYGIAAHEENSWLSELEFTNSSWEIQYANSLFWAVCTLTMMGKYQPRSFYELLFACLVMAISLILLFFGFIELKNNFADEISLTSHVSSNPRKQAQVVSKYLSKKKVNDNLKNRVLFFLEQENKRQKKQEEQLHENQVFLSLSTELKTEIRKQSNFKLLEKQDIFKVFFSQRTIDSLLLQIEEEIYLPNEVIFEEKSISDSSIFFIIEGSVGIFQGTKIDSDSDRKHVQTLQKGQVFGEISFFTGMVRQVTMIAQEYVCVGKIKREDFLSVIADNKDDLERYCMLRDQFMIYDDVNCFGSSCDSCGKTTHLLKDCPLLHLSLDNVKIIHRHIYCADQVRNQAFKRRGPAKFKGSFIMNKDSKRVYGMLLEDSVCRYKMNELINMNNYGGEDEENNEEEDEEIADEEDEDEANDFEEPGSSRILYEDEGGGHDLKDKIHSKETTSDQEEEGIKKQFTKHSKHSSNTNNNNNNNNSGGVNNNNNNNNNSGGVITNSASNNPHTDNSSQVSKANIKSQRKDSSSSQLNPETVINTKEFKKELTYNTMQTDQQFQGYEFFLQDTTSNNNPNSVINTQTIGNINNLNSLNNLTSLNKDMNVNSNINSSTSNHQTPAVFNPPQIFNNPTSIHNTTSSIYNMAGIHNTPASAHTSNYNVPSSTEHRKSIQDTAAAHHIVYDQIQRIANKKLTSQTAPQIYSKTKSFASRKSQKKTNSPEQSQQQLPQIQQGNEKNVVFPDLILDQTTSKDYNREVTQSSRVSKRQLKFADETQFQTKVSENTFKNNNPTVTSIQLSPYQESLSSRDNSNSQHVPNYILQQFQSLLLKFQFMYRQVMQTQRNTNLQMSLDKMNGASPKEGKTSDLILDQLNEKSKHRSQMSPTRRSEKNALLQKYLTTQSRNPDEWNLENMRNYKIYFPHNNFSSIYPQILFQQRNRPSPSQAQILQLPQQKPLITLSSNALMQTEQVQPSQDCQPLANSIIPIHALSLIQEVPEPRKTVSTVMSQNLGRKSAYSLTYGVQINQTKPLRQLGSLTSGSSSAYRYQMSPQPSKNKTLLPQTNISDYRFNSVKYH